MMYAVVKTSGRQEKVAVGDVLLVNRLTDKPGASIELPVIMLVDGDAVVTGDAAAKASVKAEVLAEERGKKIIILKYKNKTGYRRRLGHRQDLTRLRVTGISAGK
ncbi:MAG: 50S ribosomal protein L21 [Actinomycetota bacterium]|nr:50S ribosomal protein L21 [Actinomycetota bacterium]